MKNGVYSSGLRVGSPPSIDSTMGALLSLPAKEFFRGVVPSVTRGALMAASQLSSYDHSKHFLKGQFYFTDGLQLHMICSLISGVCACIVTAPADIIKTRIMNDRGLYRGPFDCVLKTVRADGLLALWRGAMASYLRLGPHFLMTFPLYEHLRAAFGLGYL